MAVNLAYITDIAGEFSGADSARVDRLVVIFGALVDSDFFGNLHDLALAYLVCHALKIDDLRGRGAVTSEKIGDLSRSFASAMPAASSPDSFDMTSYGRAFKELRSSCLAGPIVT